MEHFLLQLAKTSAIGGAVIALLLTLRPFLGKRYRARMYYWLWLVLAVALLPSPVYTGANAPVQITPPSEHVMVWTDKAAIVPKISHKDNFVTVPDGVTPALSHIPPGEDITQSLSAAPIRRIIDVSSVLFWAWLAGIAVFLCVQAIGYGRFRRLAHRWSGPLKNDRYAEILREEASALGLTAPKAALCPAVSTPALTGLISPKLLLPHEDYTETELRFVLRHELTHLKHRDILYKLILIFANALHWFNPLVYGMLRAADEDIELSCDSAVTRNMEKTERAAYSQTLLKAVRSKGDTVALTSCFGSTVERLKRRITNILDGRKKRRGIAVIVLAICTVAALGAAVGFVPSKSAPKTHGAYADVEDYLMQIMPAIGSEVSYYPYSEDGTILEETTAKVLDRRLAWLNQTGEVRNLAPEGTLQSWKYSYLLKLDAPADGVRLVGGMYERDGYYDLEGQGGHNLVVLQYADGSIDVLYDQYVNDNMDFYGYHNSYEEAIYDWYVMEYHLDLMKYPLYVDEFQLGHSTDGHGNVIYDMCPVHRYDGDGWYMYVPVNSWEPGVGEPIWYSSYGTDSTIVVKTFDTSLSDAQAYFKREGWEGMNEDMIFVSYEGRFSNVYLYERPAGGHYEVQTFWYDQSDEVNEWGWSAKVQVEGEQKILACMAQSFTVDERFSPALWTDPLYADALLNATTIGYVDETRSLPYFTTDILANLTRDDTHQYPAPAAFAVVDLDRDGTAEVVYRRSDYRGYIVLHLYYGGVCGHELNYREMESLKRDGSFRGSGGADDTIFTRIRFDGADMVLEREEYRVDASSGNVQKVTQEKMDDLIAAFEARPDVTWYDFTEENVRSVLGENRGTRIVAFENIMGLSGFYSETTDGAGFITRKYYVPAVVGGYTPIGGSFGYTIDDHVVDLDGDGVTELVCNCQYGADGAQRVFAYRLKNGAVEQGLCGSVYSTLPDYNNWGVNGSGEYYDADADEFVLGYSTTRGAVEMAEKRFTYRLLDFSPYAFNDAPYPQPVLPEKAAETAKPTAESIKTSAVSSVDYGGYLWFVADGYFSRYADGGSVEQLYKLPLGYDGETPVVASLSVIAAKIALSYHVGGAIMGHNELRLFDNQTGTQTHEIDGYGSFAINGDTIVKTTGFMPPAPGNLRISRDCGKTWENLGDPKYLYGMSVIADGNTISYRGEQGSLSLTDDYLYVTGIDTSSWDGSSTQIPETLSLRIDLSTGETKVGTD